ncbi:hypothetical protein AB395_00004058 [Sinorhizobium fredii CCBAU 45436]|nr:hypothetical protein AB395_00004058 [Sinorhizobium fredii CCBAU 45436]
MRVAADGPARRGLAAGMGPTAPRVISNAQRSLQHFECCMFCP